MNESASTYIADSVSLHAKSRALEEHHLSNGIICTSCRFSHVFRRKGQLNVTVMCHALAARMVPSDIAECSRYVETTAMDIREMEILALPVDGRVGVRDGSYR